MAKTDVDDEAVMSALQSGKFDIGDNPYGVMLSISNYTNSIFKAINDLQDSWNSAVQDVGEYIDIFKGIPEPEGDNLTNQATDLGDGTGASLKGVSTFLNVRSGVGTNNSTIGSLTNNTAFSVLGISGKDANGTTWYHVKYKDQNGKEVDGYVSSDYVNVDISAFDSSTPQSNSGIGLNTQASPLPESSSSESAATSNVETPSPTVNKPTFGSTQQSNSESGASSQASASTNAPASSSTSTSTSTDTKLTGEVTINNPNSHLNVRSTADSNIDNVIGQFSKGDKVEILGEENGFYRIKTSTGQTAYVSKSYINIPTNSRIPNTTLEIPSKTTVNISDTNSHLNFRSSPNSTNSNNIISGIDNGTELDVIGRSGEWTKVKYNNQEGWVYTKYLTK